MSFLCEFGPVVDVNMLPGTGCARRALRSVAIGMPMWFNRAS